MRELTVPLTAAAFEKVDPAPHLDSNRADPIGWGAGEPGELAPPSSAICVAREEERHPSTTLQRLRQAGELTCPPPTANLSKAGPALAWAANRANIVGGGMGELAPKL